MSFEQTALYLEPIHDCIAECLACRSATLKKIFSMWLCSASVVVTVILHMTGADQLKVERTINLAVNVVEAWSACTTKSQLAFSCFMQTVWKNALNVVLAVEL
ncbi:hypothetical protein Q3G72_013084 [Acer saccharum]|nr:hypothetical protein Q3G72_013084 [Acer saccharum]